MEREKQALNRRLAKAGLSDQDVTEDVEEVNEGDEVKKNNQEEADNKENADKDKDVEKIEAELKEIEVVKYKMQEDLKAMKKEYEQQMDILNFKVQNSIGTG